MVRPTPGVTTAARVALFPKTVPPETGVVTCTLVPLLIVNAIPCETVVAPPESTAVTVTVWEPFENTVVSNVVAYGEEDSAAPTFLPSTWNCTPVMVSPCVGATDADNVALLPAKVAAEAGVVTIAVVAGVPTL